MIRSPLLKVWARLFKFEVQPPEHPMPKKCVVIAFPHTTNWDFPAALAVGDVSGVPIKWLGKRQLFRGPMGIVMRKLGGVPVERSSKQGLVQALAAEFAKADQLALVVPAEGTRSKVDYWKSGFYRIAMEAKVPIVCAYVDGVTHKGGFGLVLEPTGNVRSDMDKIRAFYAGRHGLKPGNQSVPRLKEEEAVSLDSTTD